MQPFLRIMKNFPVYCYCYRPSISGLAWGSSHQLLETKIY